MIVRYALKCETCEQAHTVRIGTGQDSTQTHKFPCRKCNEEIVVRMDMDLVSAGFQVVCVENCEPIMEDIGAPIVNIDANAREIAESIHDFLDAGGAAECLDRSEQRPA